MKIYIIGTFFFRKKVPNLQKCSWNIKNLEVSPWLHGRAAKRSFATSLKLHKLFEKSLTKTFVRNYVSLSFTEIFCRTHVNKEVKKFILPLFKFFHYSWYSKIDWYV